MVDSVQWFLTFHAAGQTVVLEAFEVAAAFFAIRVSHFPSVKPLMCAFSCSGFMGGGGVGATPPSTRGLVFAILGKLFWIYCISPEFGRFCDLEL